MKKYIKNHLLRRKINRMIHGRLGMNPCRDGKDVLVEGFTAAVFQYARTVADMERSGLICYTGIRRRRKRPANSYDDRNK